MRKATPPLVAAMFVSLIALPIAQGAAPSAETHKQWMNDAADRQEDLREEMAAKNVKGVATAAVAIEDFMAKTEAYWTAKKAADIIKLAQTARAQAKDVASMANAGKLDDAKAAFEKLSATCNTCHELHPEKR